MCCITVIISCVSHFRPLRMIGNTYYPQAADHGWGTWRYFHMWPFCEIHSWLELRWYGEQLECYMAKGESHQEGSGLENSPVWTGFLINQAPFLMAMSPIDNAQVLRMNSSTSPRIKQSGIYSHFEIAHGHENIRLKDICRRKFYFADCSCSMNAILAGYLSCDNFAASCITC